MSFMSETFTIEMKRLNSTAAMQLRGKEKVWNGEGVKERESRGKST